MRVGEGLRSHKKVFHFVKLFDLKKKPILRRDHSFSNMRDRLEILPYCEHNQFCYQDDKHLVFAIFFSPCNFYQTVQDNTTPFCSSVGTPTLLRFYNHLKHYKNNRLPSTSITSLQLIPRNNIYQYENTITQFYFQKQNKVKVAVVYRHLSKTPSSVFSLQGVFVFDDGWFCDDFFQPNVVVFTANEDSSRVLSQKLRDDHLQAQMTPNVIITVAEPSVVKTKTPFCQ